MLDKVNTRMIDGDIDLSVNISGVLPTNNGGTGSSSIHAAISASTIKTPLSGAEELWINDSGSTKKTTTQAIANLGGGGGNWSLISTTTISGSPSVVDFAFTGSYRKYMFEFEDIVSASSFEFRMRTSSNGGTTFDSGSTDYTYGGGAQATYGPTYAQAGFIRLTGNVPNAADRGIYGELIIYDPLGTTRHKRIESKLSRTIWNDANSMDIDIWAGARRTTSAVDAIRFYFASGNFANVGKIRLFGWNE